MSRIKLEAQIIEDVDAEFLEKSNEFFNELTQLQQKYSIGSSVSVEPFENSSFFDLEFNTDEDFKHSDFVEELEELLSTYAVKYIYKSVID